MNLYFIKSRIVQALTLTALAFLSGGAFAQTFSNPVVSPNQDPGITYVNGTYYLLTTAFLCQPEHICMRTSATLTGLKTAPLMDIWSAPPDPTAPNYNDLWQPELHYINGIWYIYYAADDGGQAGVTPGNNSHHRLFVLQSPSPGGTWVEGVTGLPHGQLNEQSGYWGIDPNVFTGLDGKLYLAFSCTKNIPNLVPTSICLTPMNSPLSISGPTSLISTSSEPWEKRGPTDGIEEGPQGYTKGNDTYITFSASAVGHGDDYDVGVLAHYNDAGNNPDLLHGTWIKYGPIFDKHGDANAPGSLSIVPSSDTGNTEAWAFYHTEHAADSDGYKVDLRMQKVLFTSYGFPIIGYPISAGIPIQDPAGENGSPAGTTFLPDWGDAFGDAAEGDTVNGRQVGAWSLSPSLPGNYSATSSSTGQWNQVFRVWNPNVQNFSYSAQVQWVSDTGKLPDFPKYGIYCSYDDMKNHAELFIDKINNVLASHAVVAGVDQGWQNISLPAGFNASQWHTLQCDKHQSTYTFTLDPGIPGAVTASRNFDLKNGVNGIITDDTKANFLNASATQYLDSN